MIGSANEWALVKGKTFIKQMWKGEGFAPELIQPESMGVLRENHHSLDPDMEAFCHRMYITRWQFARMIQGHPDEKKLLRKAEGYSSTDPTNAAMQGAQMTVTTGALQPFRTQGQPASATGKANTVDWISNTTPQMSAEGFRSLLPLDELWVWDDERENWATFHMVGDDMFISPTTFIRNTFSCNTASGMDSEYLKGKHPFKEVCPNPLDDYFWGRSEIVNIALLQLTLNKRINGINALLRLQEDPPKKFMGSSGVNQQALARFKKPGGYFTDTNPNAKVENDAPQIPESIYVSLHETERMFDEMGGLPPIARGHGEAGVRSAGHAETLVRMFSPRFKDRALLVERDVEGLLALMLDIAKAHVAEKIVAWCPKDAAGMEAGEVNPLIVPPAPGLVPVEFSFADLNADLSLMVDSHSSSPAFSQEGKALTFDLLKIGALTPEDVVTRVDVDNPEDLIAGLQRREAAKAMEIEALKQSDPEAAKKLIAGGGKNH